MMASLAAHLSTKQAMNVRNDLVNGVGGNGIQPMQEQSNIFYILTTREMVAGVV